MPLQNRVTPFGEIVATPQRGRFTGNRGIIHDPATRTLLKRRWTTRAWIACVCEFRGRRRRVMATRSWTELFFLDEATAFAAGHRPCFTCRRADAEAFRDAWRRGNGRDRAAAPEIDAVLHAERLDGRTRRTHALDAPAGALPDGAMIAVGEDGLLIAQGAAWRWSFGGYQRANIPTGARLLTPPSIVSAFRAGYRAQIDSSAGS